MTSASMIDIDLTVMTSATLMCSWRLATILDVTDNFPPWPRLRVQQCVGCLWCIYKFHDNSRQLSNNWQIFSGNK